jgi:hypothetical protein
MNDDDMLISVVFLFLDMKSWFLWLLYVKFKAAAPPFLNLHVQSIARLIDKVVPILEEQPDFVIGTSCVLSREIQTHDYPDKP